MTDTRQLMSDAKFFSDYSRWIEDKDRYETWDEAVDRVVSMYRGKYFEEISKSEELNNMIEFADSMYKNQAVLASQRSLQFGGAQILKNNAKLYNCVSSHCNRVEFFNEFMFFLLSGSGAGASIQKHHVAKLPKIAKRKKQAKIYVVPDSIEGWSDAISVLLSSYFVLGGKHPDYRSRRVYFDLNQIRPKGSKISGGFKAPGPEPLRKALDLIEHLLENIVNDSDEDVQLRPIQVYDICMYIADSVIAGGVRRSATIFLFSHDDEEMINAKTGNWYEENPQRARSNNSAMILRNEIQWEEFQEIMKSVEDNGEPGFVFVDNLEQCMNPCVEISMLPISTSGISGWQGCNLVEINGAFCTTPEKFYSACRAASTFATLQAGFTDFPYLPKATQEIFEREALIGVSVTGWMNNPEVLFDEDVMRRGAEIVVETNKLVAAIIGINQAARTCCVKPSGNACQSFDGMIKTERGAMSLKDIFLECSGLNSLSYFEDGNGYSITNPLKVYDENNKLKDITGLYMNGTQEVYEIQFEDGFEAKFTGNHKLKTTSGWKFVSMITEDDEIISF